MQRIRFWSIFWVLTVALGVLLAWFLGNLLYTVFWTVLGGWGFPVTEAKITAYIAAHLAPFVLTLLVGAVLSLLIRNQLAATAASPSPRAPIDTPVMQGYASVAKKIRLFLPEDPFEQTTGIEFAKGENGQTIPYVQVCVEPTTDAAILDPVANVIRIDHRVDNSPAFSEVMGETQIAGWSRQPPNVRLSKGKPIRFNLFWYNESGLYDAFPMSSYKLAQAYAKIGKSGEYRYRVHVDGRDVAPSEAYVFVRWRLRGHPQITLEPIGSIDPPQLKPSEPLLSAVPIERDMAMTEAFHTLNESREYPDFEDALYQSLYDRKVWAWGRQQLNWRSEEDELSPYHLIPQDYWLKGRFEWTTIGPGGTERAKLNGEMDYTRIMFNAKQIRKLAQDLRNHKSV